MFRNIILTLFAFFIFIGTSFAKIDVVYPSSSTPTINAFSAFFVGNTDENSAFYINSEPVQLWENKFFVKVVPLEYGVNKIVLKSVKNGIEEEKIYNITRNKPSGVKSKPITFEAKNEGEVLYSKTIKENATIRDKASGASNRIVDLPENIILYLLGKQGDYYKIDEQGSSQFWIHKSNISQPVSLSAKIKPVLKKQKFYSDNLYDYHKFYLSHPVLYTAKQNGNVINLTLFGIETKDKNGNINPNFTYTYTFDRQILGFDCYYEDNVFILKIAKLPDEINPNLPLKGINIFVDAGHGGVEKGAVGPTRVNEKDINLSIANKLAALLKSAGANVITSRIDDRKVGLYDRVKLAKNNNALISISIHCNSLPNGKDPYVNHGTEVHYYNENSKMLSKIINDNLSKDLNLKNNNIHKSSFALNRSTNPVSVLIEVAYMINPEEYIFLKNTNNHQKIAESIKNSLEKYIILLKN